MATYTEKYNLNKPNGEDAADIQVLNENMDKIDAALSKKPDLDETGKVPSAQIPSLDYVPNSEKGKAGGVASLGTDGKVPSAQIPSLGYIPAAEKGKAGGVASLAADGKVPSAQIPPLNYEATGAANAAVNAHNSSATAHAGLFNSLAGKMLFPELVLTTVPDTVITVTDGTTTLTETSTGTSVLKLPNFANWRITAALWGETKTTTVEIDTVKQYPLTIIVADSTLENNSWSKIAKVSESGLANKLWSIGDAKALDFGSGYGSFSFRIVGFNHDDKADGSGKAGITFGMHYVHADYTAKMMDTATNVGGYRASNIYNTLSLIPAKLPSDLQAALKTVNKVTAKGGGVSELETIATPIFLFSPVEVFGKQNDVILDGEGQQYSYFTTSYNRTAHNSGGTRTYNYWLRSPARIDGGGTGKTNTSFYYVYTDPKLVYAHATYTACIRFGFCV